MAILGLSNRTRSAASEWKTNLLEPIRILVIRTKLVGCVHGPKRDGKRHVLIGSHITVHYRVD